MTEEEDHMKGLLEALDNENNDSIMGLTSQKIKSKQLMRYLFPQQQVELLLLPRLIKRLLEQESQVK